jgi:hypothetical protein
MHFGAHGVCSRHAQFDVFFYFCVDQDNQTHTALVVKAQFYFDAKLILDVASGVMFAFVYDVHVRRYEAHGLNILWVVKVLAGMRTKL